MLRTVMVSTDLGPPDEHRVLPLEVPGPELPTRIEQAHNIPC
jgi:hypothetical protein